MPAEAESPLVKAIADAARELVCLREAWINPPDASESDLKERTLTKIYNLRTAGKCTWLENAHRAIDQTVFAAYGAYSFSFPQWFIGCEGSSVSLVRTQKLGCRRNMAGPAVLMVESTAL